MRARCPHCFKTKVYGCEFCKDGFVNVGVAAGVLYHLHCSQCGDDIGFHVDSGGDEPPDVGKNYIVCPACETGDNLKWEAAGYSDGLDLSGDGDEVPA